MHEMLDETRIPLGLPRYRIVRELGCGGMGRVYQAEHAELGRSVAIKVLHPNLRQNATARSRFLREGRLAARLQHPHVVEVIDAGSCDAGPYLVMEYVDGPTVAEYLREAAPLSIERALELILPIVSALAYAHDRGVVHRDVKPANIFLGRDCHGAKSPKIGDFGIAKWLDSSGDRASLTREGIIGSFPYIAPEQIREARTVDARADQYSLAVVLYQAVAGRLPVVDGDGAFALMEAICEGRVTPLGEAAVGVPHDFARIVHRAMSIDADQRLPSLAALGRELVRFSAGRSSTTWNPESRIDGTSAPGETADDSLAASTDARAPTKTADRAPRAVWRAALVPAACLAIGAAGTAGVLRTSPFADASNTRKEARTAAQALAPVVDTAVAAADLPAPIALEPLRATPAGTGRPVDPPSRFTPPAAPPRSPGVPPAPAMAAARAAAGNPPPLGANHAPILE